jgi:hypothetical protein
MDEAGKAATGGDTPDAVASILGGAFEVNSDNAFKYRSSSKPLK